jgi:hypothetical protein
MTRLSATVGSVSRAYRGSGEPFTILVCSLPAELLGQLRKGQPIELVLSSSLPPSPADQVPTAAFPTDAESSEDDLSSPPATDSRPPDQRGSPETRCEPVAGGPLPSTDTAELVASFQPVPAPEVPTTPGTAAGGAMPAAASGLGWMLTEHQPDWSGNEAAAYSRGIKGAGYDTATVGDLCELLTEHRLRPRHLGVRGRRDMFRWLRDTDAGRAAYTDAAEARAQLVEAARRLKVKERKEAAERAGTDTQPAELSARELWRLLEQAGPQSTATKPPRPPEPEPEMGTCRSCGSPVVWIQGKGDTRHICDPTVLTASPKGSGARVQLVCDDAVIRAGSLDPDGHIVGRISHFATCPDAEKHRKPRRTKEVA